MKSIARFLMPTLVLALVGIVGSTITALAQDFPPPIGTRLRCPFNGTISIDRDGALLDGTVTGSGTFEVIATTENTATYIPVEIEATSTFPQLGDEGTFTTRLNTTVPAPASTAASVDASVAVFPVVIPMIYPPIVTDPRGDEFTSQGNVNFLINVSNSFNPIVGEVSNLENPVTFVAEDGRSFKLVSLTATFNP